MMCKTALNISSSPSAIFNTLRPFHAFLERVLHIEQRENRSITSVSVCVYSLSTGQFIALSIHSTMVTFPLLWGTSNKPQQKSRGTVGRQILPLKP